MAAAPDLRVRDSLLPSFASLPGMESTASNPRFSVRQQVADDADANPGAHRTVLTAFVWRVQADDQVPSSVAVTGSFLNWGPPIPLRQAPAVDTATPAVFVRLVEIPPGEYLFRFYVDGVWRVVDNDPSILKLSDGTQAHFLPVGDAALDFAADDILQEEVVDAMHDHKEVARVHKTPRNHNTAPAYTIRNRDRPRRRDVLLKILGIFWPFGRAKRRGAHAAAAAAVRDSDDTLNCGSDTDSEPVDRTFDADYHVAAPAAGPGKILFPGEEEHDELGRAPPPAASAAPAGAPPNARANIVNQDIPNEFGMEIKGAKPRTYMAAENNAMERQEVARVLFNQGKFDNSLAMYGLAIKIREENGLKMSPQNVMAHLEMGTTLFHLDEFKAAEKHFRVALGIWQHGDALNFVLEDKQKFGDLLQFLAVALDRQRQRLEADHYYREALKAYERSGVEGPNVDTCQENLALVERKLIKQGKVPGTFVPTTREIVLDEPLQPTNMNKERLAIPSSPTASVAAAGPPAPPPPPPPPPRQNVPAPPPPPPAPAEKENQRPSRASTVDEGDRLPELRSVAHQQNVKTWHGLATRARSTMPAQPQSPAEGPLTPEEQQFEAMADKWVSNARLMREMHEYEVACDLYILAVFARRKGGRWYTTANVKMLQEFATMCLRNGSVAQAVHIMQETVGILGKTEETRNESEYGRVFQLYSAVLRADGKDTEADRWEDRARKAGVSVSTRDSYRRSERNSILMSRASISHELRRASGLPGNE